jgi:hypothetical protein
MTCPWSNPAVSITQERLAAHLQLHHGNERKGLLLKPTAPLTYLKLRGRIEFANALFSNQRNGNSTHPPAFKVLQAKFVIALMFVPDQKKGKAKC